MREAAPLLALVVGILPAAGRSEEGPRLDPDLPYQARKGNPVTYDVDSVVAVTAPYGTKLLRVWLPLPPTDAGQEVEEMGLTTFPQEVEARVAAEPTYGNRFAHFEFPKPAGAQVIRHRFRVKVWELYWDLDPAKVVPVSRWPAGFNRYLRSDQSVVVDDRFRELARDIVPRRRGAARDLEAVLAWADRHLTYDHGRASLRASAEHALQTRRGHCSDYHGLCAAVGRALGYPTRVTYGINPLPKQSPSHCKLEAYLPPYGWVSFDVSETQKLAAEVRRAPSLTEAEKGRLVGAAAERLRRGFRDNTWFVQTRGTDYDLAPPASRRVPVVRTIYAEADGVPLPDPDPADPEKREFAWMTAHRYTPDRAVEYPFKSWKSLAPAGE